MAFQSKGGSRGRDPVPGEGPGAAAGRCRPEKEEQARDTGDGDRARAPLAGDDPAELRTYTLRKIDTDNGAFDIDFVVHGADGVAGPWAERAEIDEVIPFAGPGGTWAPRPGAARHVFVGDESALPAVAAGVGNLSDEDVADVFLEVSGEDAHVALPVRESVRVHWVHRGDATPGTRLVEAVRAAGADAGEDCEWFVHGVAEMVREMRRFLFVDAGVPRGRVSISGYWRLGMVEDEWQASKREFTAAAEAAEAAGVPGNR